MIFVCIQFCLPYFRHSFTSQALTWMQIGKVRKKLSTHLPVTLIKLLKCARIYLKKSWLRMRLSKSKVHTIWKSDLFVIVRVPLAIILFIWLTSLKIIASFLTCPVYTSVVKEVVGALSYDEGELSSTFLGSVMRYASCVLGIGKPIPFQIASEWLTSTSLSGFIRAIPCLNRVLK